MQDKYSISGLNSLIIMWTSARKRKKSLTTHQIVVIDNLSLYQHENQHENLQESYITEDTKQPRCNSSEMRKKVS